MSTTSVDSLVQDLIGKPFLIGASGPDHFDCWGLVREVTRRLGGPELPDFGHQQLSTTGQARLMNKQALVLTTPVTELRDGDLAYHWRRAHLGIVVDGGVLHASFDFGVIWQQRADFLVLYPGVEWLRWRAT